MSLTSWTYPTNKMLGGIVVWVTEWEGGKEFFLPQAPETDLIRVDRFRSSRERRTVYIVRGGTEAARNRLLKECIRKGVLAKLA